MEPGDIHTQWYWIPADSATWPDRMEAGCRALEALLGRALSLQHAGTKFHMTTKEIADRPKLFRQRLRTKHRWCSVSSRRVLPAGERDAERVSLGGSMYAGGELFKVGITIAPELPFTIHERVLAQAGDALGARFSAFLPRATQMRLRLAHHCIVFGGRVNRFELPDRTPEEAALPTLCESLYSGLHPLQPHELGWLNYWSQEVCDYIGFPANLEGSPCLSDCYRTPAGAWIVKFGAEPFEPANAGHVELLKSMYERFPRVGVRLDAQGL